MGRPAERYKLIERIGAGGLGVVHRALDRATGQEVAVKIMPRPRGGTNLRDEFVALARLRHRNIVAVLDYGLTDAGHEYFTMELVIGPSLATAAKRGERTWFGLADGILDALAFVHARGMVHADLKPSNVLVDGAILATDPAAAVRLADFGLAAPTAVAEPRARARDGSDPAIPIGRGTIAYAAPEAWAGAIDTRSDLYSFGVMLYELATGERPYAAATARDVLAAQRRGPPADPRQLRPDLAPALAELMVALCDPVPSARPQTADEVRDRLADHAPGPRRVRTAAPEAAPPQLGGALVGRDRELDDLERAWRDARASRGGVALVLGEEGMGASRIMAELAIRVQLDHGTVVRAVVGDGGWSGLDTAVRALLAIAGDRWPGDGADAAVRRRALAPLLLGKSDPADDRSRWGTAEAATQLALTAASERPVAILIDDVHRASAAALDVLAYLARAAADQPLLVVLGGRKSQQVGDATARLGGMVRGAVRALRLDLAPLDRAGILELATAAIGRPLAERLVDDLVRACGGNPGHVLRALETMAQRGQLRRVHGAWDSEGALVVPMPPAVLDAARARLGRLPVASRAVLRAAAATGDEFDRVVVGAALGVAIGDDPIAAAIDAHAHAPVAAHSDAVPEVIGEEVVSISVSVQIAMPDAATAHAEPADDPGQSRRLAAVGSIAAIDAALAEAVAARLLTADPAAGTFRFAHHELARALASELSVADRQPLQRRAATALAARRDPPAAALTRLGVALGDREMARRWGVAAADAA
ncbi:MAG: protein kinase, partial [Deltaproteobacteria bacterium]|nr:protein kinase [Deltaproteobacteria bacterium]